MGTAVKHPASGRVKPSFAIFDIRALWRSAVKIKTLTDKQINKLNMNTSLSTALENQNFNFHDFPGPVCTPH